MRDGRLTAQLCQGEMILFLQLLEDAVITNSLDAFLSSKIQKVVEFLIQMQKVQGA